MDALINLFGGMFIGLSLSIFLFVLFPVGLAYVALRVRDSRAAVPDPKLGLKLAYHVIQSLAVLMVLIGLSISSADLMQGILGGNQRNAAPDADEFWNVPQRSAAALVGTGALFTLCSGCC